MVVKVFGQTEAAVAAPVSSKMGSGTIEPMHPKALLDNCASLLKQVLKFDYPADMVL